MTTINHQYKAMLSQYDKQQATSQYIVKPSTVPVNVQESSLQGSMNAEAAEKEKDIKTKKSDLRRRLLVERVARELFDNLLFTQTDNPVVKEIRTALNEECEAQYVMKYQLGSKELQVFQETDTGLQEVPQDRKAPLIDKLWNITLKKVDETLQGSQLLNKESNMEIKSSSNPINAYSRIGSQNITPSRISKTNTATSATAVSSTQGDTINVSSEGMLRTEAFRVAMNTSDIRQEKVDSIKAKIAEGSYTIDTKKLAFNLIREESFLNA